MHGWENHHRVVVFHTVYLVGELARIDVCYLFVHVEEVSVTLQYNVDAETLDAFREVEEHGKTSIVYTVSLVATLFGCTAGNVARNQVTECRITAFQIVVTVFFRNIATFLCSSLQSLGVLKLLRHPYASVITQRLRHKRQF